MIHSSVNRAGVFIFLLMVLGCDNSIQPTEEESAGYSIYGKLDLLADSNFIRVNDLNTALLASQTEQFEGKVFLENRNTGSTEKLPFRRVLFNDVYVYNFYTTQTIEDGTDYRVYVNRNGITESEASVSTPGLASVSVVQEGAGGCNDLIRVSLDPVAENEFIAIRLGFTLSNTVYWYDLPSGTQNRTDGIYERSFFAQEVLDERFLNNPAREFERRVVCGDLSEREILFEYTHYHEGFEDERLEGFQTGGAYTELIAQYSQSFSIAIKNN